MHSSLVRLCCLSDIVQASLQSGGRGAGGYWADHRGSTELSSILPVLSVLQKEN